MRPIIISRLEDEEVKAKAITMLRAMGPWHIAAQATLWLAFAMLVAAALGFLPRHPLTQWVGIAVLPYTIALVFGMRDRAVKAAMNL